LIEVNNRSVKRTMPFESISINEHLPSFQFFKTEFIFILAVICIISLVLTILWFLVLICYIRLKDTSQKRLKRNYEAKKNTKP
jgi:hypothetical protein